MSRQKDNRPANAERRAEIKAAARKVFRAEGYSGTRMDLIAAEVGLSVGGLYLYFADKEALFQELLAEDLAQTVAPEDVCATLYRYLPFQFPAVQP